MTQCKHSLELEKKRVVSADNACQETQRKWAQQMEVLSEEATNREKGIALKLQEEQRAANNIREALVLAQTKLHETSSERDVLRDELQEANSATKRAEQNALKIEVSKDRIEKKTYEVQRDQEQKLKQLQRQLNSSQADLVRARSKVDELSQRVHVAESTIIHHESETHALRETLSRTRVQKASTISDISELASQLKRHQDELYSLRDNQMELIGKRDAVAVHLRDLQREKERVLMEMEMERRRASEDRLKQISHSKLLLESIKLGADSFSREMNQIESDRANAAPPLEMRSSPKIRNRGRTY